VSDSLGIERQLGGQHFDSLSEDALWARPIQQIRQRVPEQSASLIPRFAEHALWVDRQPRFALGREDVAMMEVAVEKDRLGAGGQ